MKLKLISFRIQDFRCVVDTNWQNLSQDNITGIIGQNESGKSSIIEALNSFYTGKISPDDVRSLGGLPKVSCSFECSTDFLEELLNIEKINSVTIGVLRKLKRINLIREWTDLKNSKVTLEEDSLKVSFEMERYYKSPKNDSTTGNESEKIISKKENDDDENPVLEEKTTEKLDEYIKEDEFIALITKNLPIFEFFVDFSSLLPNQIDLAEVQSENQEIEGYKGAINLLTLAGLDLKFLTESDERIIANRIKRTNEKVTADFREFWRQKIGKTNKISLSIDLKNYPDSNVKKSGKPYIAFWVEDGPEKLYPKQRSKGVRWFLSFYLQLKASKLKAGFDKDRGQVMLIDEPGMSLHARAQEDVLKVFDDIKESITVIYTTHSPYLVKIENLYRILAAQRKDEEDENSETFILDFHKLACASSDTLTPIYTSMGIDLSGQNVIKKSNNLILEEPSAYYYLQAFIKLTGSKRELQFLPATSVDKIPQLVYLFLGWGLDFYVLVDDDRAGNKVYNDLERNIFAGDSLAAAKKMGKIVNCKGIEDIFSKTDFRKYIVSDTSGDFEGLNSDYFVKKGVSKILKAVNFKIKVANNEIKATDFTQDTNKKIARLMKVIESFS